jgi:hypothetical protein
MEANFIMAIASKFFSKRFLERVPGIVKVI